MNSWRVPPRGKGEGKQRYRDRLNGRIKDFRKYDNDRFSREVRVRMRDHIKKLEKAIRALLEPGAR